MRLKNKIFSFALALFLFFGLALNSALAPKAVAGNVVGVTPWKDSEKGLEYIFISHSKPSTCAVDYAYMLQSKKVKERALHLRFDLSQKNNSPIVSEKGQIGLILTFHDKSSYILKIDGSEQIPNPAKISIINKSLTFGQDNDCTIKMDLSFLAGLPDRPLQSVQFSDSLGKYSHIYYIDEKPQSTTNPTTKPTSATSTKPAATTYKIKFDANGGRGGKTFNLEAGSMPAPPAVSREGYIFKGWSPTVTKVKGDAVYKAVWVKLNDNRTTAKPALEKHKIKFDANGGRGGKTFTLEAGSMPAPPAVSREGYIFNGWSPTVTKVKGDAVYKAVWVKINDNKTTAKPTVDKYKIKFDANGGRGGKTFNLEAGSIPFPPTVSKTGYIFMGWDKAIKPVSGDTTYMAVWERRFLNPNEPKNENAKSQTQVESSSQAQDSYSDEHTQRVELGGEKASESLAQNQTISADSQPKNKGPKSFGKGQIFAVALASVLITLAVLVFVRALSSGRKKEE